MLSFNKFVKHGFLNLMMKPQNFIFIFIELNILKYESSSQPTKQFSNPEYIIYLAWNKFLLDDVQITMHSFWMYVTI